MEPSSSQVPFERTPTAKFQIQRLGGLSQSQAGRTHILQQSLILLISEINCRWIFSETSSETSIREFMGDMWTAHVKLYKYKRNGRKMFQKGKLPHSPQCRINSRYLDCYEAVYTEEKGSNPAKVSLLTLSLCV